MLKHALFVVLAAVLSGVPYVGDNYDVQIASFVCLYAALALAWNFIGGYAGYPSFAAAAFVGLGSYAGALLQKAGLPMVWAWVAATLVVGVFGAALGYAILRIKGHYFAIGSFATVEILRLVTSSWADLTGGGNGLNIPFVPGSPAEVGRMFLYAFLAVMAAAYVMSVLVERSRLGFGLRCIKQNESAAESLGINVSAYKIAAFTLSAIPSATVGAISASWTGYISPTDAFSILLTLKVPVMAMLGGVGTVWGPIVGATGFVLLEQTVWARFLDWNHAVLGVLIVLLVFFMPNGLLRLRPGRWFARGAKPDQEGRGTADGR
ncbi:MAG: branched-chain amino acid ABC transporter permease [Burkholderiales bacterium]|nr:branched-chain amino acid ABC transporter permease [Burkholderiales bacterium]